MRFWRPTLAPRPSAHRLPYNRSALTIYAWTADTEPDIQRLMELGVDAIATNYPERAQLLGATFRLHSRPGLGTRVRVEVVAEPPEA